MPFHRCSNGVAVGDNKSPTKESTGYHPCTLCTSCRVLIIFYVGNTELAYKESGKSITPSPSSRGYVQGQSQDLSTRGTRKIDNDCSRDTRQEYGAARLFSRASKNCSRSSHPPSLAHPACPNEPARRTRLDTS